MKFKTGEADCVMLLLCKLKPFVWSMQKAVNQRIVGEIKRNDDINRKENDDRMHVFFKFLPTSQEFRNNGLECEESYPTCKLF